MDSQWAFHFDASACTGCKACQVACKDKNDLPVGVSWRRVIEYAGGGWRPEGGLWVPVGIFAYHVSLSCMHCAEPACMAACPAAAIRKREDGVVLVDSTRCLGCHYCEWSCPYGAPQFGLQGDSMSKCDFCVDLLALGQNPVCVDACPTRALHWGELGLIRETYGQVQALEPLPGPDQTGPSFIVTPHRHAQLPGQGTGRVARMPEPRSRGGGRP
jgi:anaerobic dimethyl sulfoxide reductase subunit B (iron-sulfur subunit)